MRPNEIRPEPRFAAVMPVVDAFTAATIALATSFTRSVGANVMGVEPGTVGGVPLRLNSKIV